MDEGSKRKENGTERGEVFKEIEKKMIQGRKEYGKKKVQAKKKKVRSKEKD